MFYCFFCGFVFFVQFTLQLHIRCVHDARRSTCDWAVSLPSPPAVLPAATVSSRSAVSVVGGETEDWLGMEGEGGEGEVELDTWQREPGSAPQWKNLSGLSMLNFGSGLLNIGD